LGEEKCAVVPPPFSLFENGGGQEGVGFENEGGQEGVSFENEGDQEGVECTDAPHRKSLVTPNNYTAL